jgi:glycosyltransferase involved in cell wall biosynthesis
MYSGFERIELVYSGVDLDLIAAAAPNPAAEGSVLFASLPRRTKGFHNLLQAWRIVRREVPDARLRVCGSARTHDPAAVLGPSGLLDRELEEEFADLLSTADVRARSGIILLGPQSLESVYSEMKAAAIVTVNCNWSGSLETYCRAAVEAQVAGAAVVGARRGALPEVVRDGQTGILVNAASHRKLAEVTVQLLRHPEKRASIGGAAQAWARPLGEYERLAPLWAEVAQRALTGAAAPASRRLSGDILRHIGYGWMRRRIRDRIRGSAVERALLKWGNP